MKLGTNSTSNAELSTLNVQRRKLEVQSVPSPSAPSAKSAVNSAAASPSTLSLDDAIDVLCDVLIARVRVALDAQLETVLAQRIATSAIKLAPKPAKGIDLEKINTLDDATIKLEIIKAQASGDRLRLFKLVALRRKREEAANTIAFRSEADA